MPRDLYKPLATPFSALFLVCTGDTLEFRISTFTSQELEFCNTLLEVDDTKVSMISFSVMTRGLILSIIKLLISSSRSDVNVETPLSCIVNSTADILSLMSEKWIQLVATMANLSVYLMVQLSVYLTETMEQYTNVTRRFIFSVRSKSR